MLLEDTKKNTAFPVAHWKTKGSLENEQYQSQITKKDREREEKLV